MPDTPKLSEIRERCEKATPVTSATVRAYENIDPDPGDNWDGCFYAVGHDHIGKYNPSYKDCEARKLAEDDAEFFKQAKPDIESCLALLDRCREMLEECRNSHGACAQKFSVKDLSALLAELKE